MHNKTSFSVKIHVMQATPVRSDQCIVGEHHFESGVSVENVVICKKILCRSQFVDLC